MKFTPLPHVTILKELLDYDPTTGILTWRERDSKWFSDGFMSAAGRANNWNSKNAGKEALGNVNVHGYKCGTLLNTVVRSHRVIWALVNGEEPAGEIDHINGVRHDNRIANLRCVSSLDNSRNTCLYKNNASGVTGVHWLHKNKKWRAVIRVRGQNIHLGVFSEIADAAAARKKAEIELGFHENHGRH